MNEITKWQIATGVLALLFIVSLINGGIPTYEAAADTTVQQETKADMTVLSDDVVKGNSNAPITIILYSDPSCPFCAAAAGASEMVSYMKSRSPDYEAAVPGIIKNFVDKGKARLVFRYYPGHGTGAEAMKIMLCANEQGKFWELHDLVFENYASTDNADLMLGLAESVGADMTKITTCLANGKYDAKLAKDTQLGRESGVSGTPAFIVNGQLVSGAQPYSIFEQGLNSLLG